MQPVLQDDMPVYMQFRNKSKTINYDEELIVLFFSVLDYLHNKYHFRILRNVNYDTYPKEVEKLITSGRMDEAYRNRIREKFRRNLIDELKNKYHFYLLQSKTDRQDAINKHFRRLNGMIFNSFKDGRLLLMAYEKGKRGAVQLFEEIKNDFKVIRYQLGQDVHEAIQRQPEISLEQKVKPVQATLFPMTGRKLEDVRDDADVYNLVWRTMILDDMASNPSEIISSCHTNFVFLDRYPGMQHRDWYKVIMQFIHDVQECYDLEVTEIFRLVA